MQLGEEGSYVLTFREREVASLSSPRKEQARRIDEVNASRSRLGGEEKGQRTASGAQSGKKEEGAAGARKEDWANKHCRLGRGEGGNKGVRLRSITREAYAHTHVQVGVGSRGETGPLLWEKC